MGFFLSRNVTSKEIEGVFMSLGPHVGGFIIIFFFSLIQKYLKFVFLDLDKMEKD